MPLHLNCDLGEGLDAIDAEVMPFIDMANIACGGHCGDTASMKRTLALITQEAKRGHQVLIGAHPSYPDKKNFGRVSMPITADRLVKDVLAQVEALSVLAHTQKLKLAYIKPHGALYNDANINPMVLATLIRAAQQASLPLVIQALPTAQALPLEADVIFEAFADRAYTNEGLLVPRNQPHALHTSADQIVAQVSTLAQKRSIKSDEGRWLALEASTVCIHSDTPNAAHSIERVRALLDSLNV